MPEMVKSAGLSLGPRLPVQFPLGTCLRAVPTVAKGTLRDIGWPPLESTEGRALRASRRTIQALDASVRKRSRILSVDVRMAGTGNYNRLNAQDPTRRRLLPLWPDLVVGEPETYTFSTFGSAFRGHTS
jgi:hypothetical protein